MGAKWMVLFLLTFAVLSASANHLVGGELTWACLGNGQYIFQVKVYQDCNQMQPPPTTMQIKVWNNPNLSVIPLTIVGSNDFSFACNEVTGSDPQFTCASPGVGSVTEYILQSAPLTLSGVPPADGWHFTWDAFFRTSVAQNLVNAQNAGLTLYASMYSYNGQDVGTCFDSSPRFIKPPLNVVCSGTDIKYNVGAFDDDLDSIAYHFSNPLNNDFGTSFNPPVSPSEVLWASGYNTNSQLPSTVQNASNTPASLNVNNGMLSFKSFTLGNFSTVVEVESWRCGQLIAVVHREMLVNIVNCNTVNSPPSLSINGITNNSVTVNAGATVTFDVIAQDNDLLADGTNQSITLDVYGGENGAGLTDPNNGCPYPPCAVCNTGAPVSGTQTVTSVFSWETSCDLFTEDCYRSQKTFYFTIYAQDDFCSIPGQTETTVAVTVINKPPVADPAVHCLSVDASGGVTINWEQPVNPDNSFTGYKIYATNNSSFNLVATESNINTTSYYHTSADANNASVKYLVKSVFGCNESENAVSDTLSSIYLQVNNPSDGTAILQWNKMSSPPLSSAYGWYYIYQEYPSGTWTLIDSTQYGTEYYKDTISVCDAYLNYRIELKDDVGCTSVSNIDGDQFQDMLPPNLPVLNWVTVDTATGNTVLNWMPSTSGDAESYIIFQFYGGGWTAIDTVHGHFSNEYINTNSNANDYSETYALATYDSCWNPTPNTSPLGIGQETIFLTNSYDICSNTVTLNWNAYKNWSDGVLKYEIYAKDENTGASILAGETTDTTFAFASGTANHYYCLVVKAIANDLFKTSLSNKSCVFLHQPPVPMFNYLQTATVIADNEVEIRVHQDLPAQIKTFRLLRADNSQPPNFEEILSQSNPQVNPVVFNDFDVNANEKSYLYKVQIEDSCGRPTLLSNLGKTILLTVNEDNNSFTNLLQWSRYKQWNGNLVGYKLYRAVNGTFDNTPIATLPPTQQYYNDNIIDIIQNQTDGKICYFVEAIESTNTYGISEKSRSNIACAKEEPLLYIPNALIIGGYNNTWKPVVNLIDFSEYKVQVYNRFSELIFESSDPEEAWDGRHRKSGKLVQLGLYLYRVSYRNARGDFQETRGHITLVR